MDWLNENNLISVRGVRGTSQKNERERKRINEKKSGQSSTDHIGIFFVSKFSTLLLRAIHTYTYIIFSCLFLFFQI